MRIRRSLFLALSVSVVAAAHWSDLHAQNEPAEPAPAFVLTPQDLNELSPKARREVQALLARKQNAAPAVVPQRGDGVGVNVGPLFRSNVDRGNVDVRILGGLIRIQRGSRHPIAPQNPILNESAAGLEDAPPHDESASQATYDHGITGVTLLPSPDARPEQGLGIHVDAVRKASPADLAGLREGDVLTVVDDQPLKSMDRFNALVEASQGRELELTYAREQEIRKTTLQPKKREPAARPTAEFPADLSITVHKTGAEPATIIVRKGEREWTVRSDELDQLDAEVRPYVLQLFDSEDEGAPPQPAPELGAPAARKSPPVTPGIDLGTPESLPAKP